jgi:uroporphyrin-III C-methyltransferase / precorrin-2 dehydrogenase / sirohydrochlorin ferrochelatase
VTPDRAYFAAFLDLRDCLAVVVGGGSVGEAKVRTLLRSGARVRVVAPVLGEALRQQVHDGAVEHRARRFEPADVEGATLVIAATDDGSVNAGVAGAARERGIAVNVADDPALSTFIMPAVVDRGAIQLAISTGGASPVLARRVAALVDAAVAPEFARLADFAAEYRDAVKRRFGDVISRRAFWERALDGDISRLVLAGREAEARALIEAELAPLPPGA